MSIVARTELAAQKSRRNFGLDVLRSVAIAMVICNHYFLGFIVGSQRASWQGFAAGASTVTVLAIEWLFVLSGFLIGTMMIRSFEAGATWWHRARDFWLRRWFRTVPNYYLFLAVNFVLAAEGIAHGVFSYKFVVFSQNLAWPERSPLFFGEAWSLATDEWFYLVMPLLVGLAMLVRRMEARTAFLLVALTLITLPAIGRLFATPYYEFLAWDANVRRVTILHLDATGWGVLAAAVNRWLPGYWKTSIRGKAVLGVLLTLLGLAIIETLVLRGWTEPLARVFSMAALTLPAAGAFCLLPWLARLEAGGRYVNFVVDRVSLYSYTLYLCHFPALLLVLHGFGIDSATPLPRFLMASVVWLAATFVIAALVFHSFEKPVSDLRERLTRKVNANPF